MQLEGCFTAGLEVGNVVGMSCVTSSTPTKMAPFIDIIGEWIIVLYS